MTCNKYDNTECGAAGEGKQVGGNKFRARVGAMGTPRILGTRMQHGHTTNAWVQGCNCGKQQLEGNVGTMDFRPGDVSSLRNPPKDKAAR